MRGNSLTGVGSWNWIIIWTLVPIRRIPRPLHLITVGSRCSQGISNIGKSYALWPCHNPFFSERSLSLPLAEWRRTLTKSGIAGTFQLHSEALPFRAVLRGLLERTNRQPPMVSYSFKSRTAGPRLIHRLGCPELFYLQHCKHCQRSLFARVATRSYFVPPKLGAGSHEGVLSP